LGFVFELGFGFSTEGHNCFLQSYGCAIEVMVAERLWWLSGWFVDGCMMRCPEVCAGARRGSVKGFAEWGYLDGGES
jgi:hypothetical protein